MESMVTPTVAAAAGVVAVAWAVCESKQRFPPITIRGTECLIASEAEQVASVVVACVVLLLLKYLLS